MREILFKQAKQILASFDNKEVKEVLAKLEEVEKEGGIGDFINSPSYHNIINILGPLAVYYKVDQVLKLLKEMGNEFNNANKKPFAIVPQYMKQKLY